MTAKTKPLSPEELMKPRYEVMIDYPNSPFKVGDIISHVREVAESYDEWECDGEYHNTKYDTFATYPSVFRKLSWWEKREAGKMPDYVKLGKGEDTVVYKWGVDVKFGLHTDGVPFGLKFKNGGGLLADYLPDQEK